MDDDDDVCKMSVEFHTRKQRQHQQQLDGDGKRSRRKAQRMSLGSIPRAAVAKAAVSLKRVNLSKDSSGAHFALFMLKVGALELFRRGVRHRFPPLWWLVQAIPLFRAPPFLWLQRWSPFRSLIEGTQVFSKPVVFLSIATSLASVVDHRPQEHQNDSLKPPSRPATPRSPAPAPVHEESREIVEQATVLRNELEEQGIFVPDRITNDDLERFFQAASRNTKRFVALVKKNISWRENFRFLTPRELEEWSQLVYWHREDAHGRPLLIVRLGVASSSLVASQRPRFIQSIVSQIEFGVLNLVTGADPRMIVVLDCAGAPSVGFPLHMTKSCCVLVQENYPTRLAALFIVNLPPFVRVLANAIVQIVKPATRDKIYVESENTAKLLADHLGGMDWVPIYLGGICKCSLCNEARAAVNESPAAVPPRGSLALPRGSLALPRSSLALPRGSLAAPRRASSLLGDPQADDPLGIGNELEEEMTPYQSCTRVIRIAIVGLLMLWIVVALIAGLYEPHLNQLPT